MKDRTGESLARHPAGGASGIGVRQRLIDFMAAGAVGGRPRLARAAGQLLLANLLSASMKVALEGASDRNRSGKRSRSGQRRSRRGARFASDVMVGAAIGLAADAAVSRLFSLAPGGDRRQVRDG